METACLPVGRMPSRPWGGGGAGGGRASLSNKPVLPPCSEEEMQLQGEELTPSKVVQRIGGQRVLIFWLFFFYYNTLTLKDRGGDFRGLWGARGASGTPSKVGGAGRGRENEGGNFKQRKMTGAQAEAGTDGFCHRTVRSVWRNLSRTNPVSKFGLGYTLRVELCLGEWGVQNAPRKRMA